MEFIHKKTEEGTKENINMIKSMVSEYINGLMEEDMKVNGVLEGDICYFINKYIKIKFK